MVPNTWILNSFENLGLWISVYLYIRIVLLATATVHATTCWSSQGHVFPLATPLKSLMGQTISSPSPFQLKKNFKNNYTPHRLPKAQLYSVLSVAADNNRATKKSHHIHLLFLACITGIWNMLLEALQVILMTETNQTLIFFIPNL